MSKNLIAGIFALGLAALYGVLASQAEPISQALGWTAAILVGLSGLAVMLKRDQ